MEVEGLCIKLRRYKCIRIHRILELASDAVQPIIYMIGQFS